MLNVPITQPRVPLIDSRTGNISREWYQFFLSLYTITGSATGVTPVANGGTGADNAADARTNLGVTATGADTTYAYRANNLSDLASASTARTNLGLGTIATQDANNVSITGGSITGTDLNTQADSNSVLTWLTT